MSETRRKLLKLIGTLPLVGTAVFDTVMASAEQGDKQVGHHLLIEEGLMSAADLQQVMAIAKRYGVMLGRMSIDNPELLSAFYGQVVDVEMEADKGTVRFSLCGKLRTLKGLRRLVGPRWKVGFGLQTRVDGAHFKHLLMGEEGLVSALLKPASEWRGSKAMLSAFIQEVARVDQQLLPGRFVRQLADTRAWREQPVMVLSGLVSPPPRSG